MAERLDWHLGFGHPSRSALQLAHWASVIEAPLVLSVAAYSPELPTRALQMSGRLAVGSAASDVRPSRRALASKGWVTTQTARP